jgi:peptidoglycan/LPS O-acetylase OafA/YrhL
MRDRATRILSFMLVSAAFFWKFFQRTRDGLFLGMAAGFGILAAHWAALGVLNPGDETRHLLYIARLLAFVVMIAGVVAKNRSPRRPISRTPLPGPRR